MDRLRKWLGNLGVLLALAAGLAAWIAMPWYAVLAVALALGLWLALTRQGRLALAASQIGIASLPQRWGASAVIVVGIAGVVGVLVAMLAMGEGFKSTPESNGQRRDRDRPAGRLAGRDQFRHHARPDSPDQHPRRYRARLGRPPVGVA